jgi:glycosyltransferase involved in cell wall biosynthesis
MNNTISIITINYNNLSGLKKTVESVLSQSYNNFEYIIIDGNSTDGSKEYINDKSANFDYWVCEPDYGIYNAMNKGIKVSNGDYLFFLNSGDYFYSDYVLENISSYLGVADHICGRMFWQNNNNTLEEYHYQKSIPNFEYFFNYTIPHQVVFSKRALFYDYNFFDEDLRICADWKFLMLTLLKYNCSYVYVNAIVSVRSRGGISNIPDNYTLIESEREKVLKQFFSNHFYSYLDLKKYRGLKSSKFMSLLQKFGFFKYLPFFIFIFF